MPTNSEKDRTASQEKVHISKKCPECYHYLPLEARRCDACGARVGKVDKYGSARRPTDWKAYLICILAWVSLGLYVRWAFF